jgi:hypothetical protein
VDIQVNPRTLSFGIVAPRQSETIPFSLTPSDSDKIKIIGVRLENSEFFSVRRLDKKDQDKFAYELTFKGSEQKKRFYTNLLVEYTNEADAKKGSTTITVPVRVNVAGDLKYPKKLYFRKTDGKYSERRLFLHSRTGKNFRVKKIVDKDNLLTVKPVPGEKKAKGRVNFIVGIKNPDKKLKSGTDHSLILYTTSHEDPVVTVSYTILNGKSPRLRAPRHIPAGLRR